jgi:hypothetical protein
LKAFARGATPVTGHSWGGSPDADACKPQPRCSLPQPTPALAPTTADHSPLHPPGFLRPVDGTGRRPAATADWRPANPSSGGWPIRHDVSCRDVCAPLDRVARWADVLLPGMTQGRIHPGNERRDVCATRSDTFFWPGAKAARMNRQTVSNSTIKDSPVGLPD